MQLPQPRMTPYEEHITQAYQLLTMSRLEASVYSSTAFCLNRCTDTEELYTLLRTTQAPFAYRNKVDLAEKQCVARCGAKWEGLIMQIKTEANAAATSQVQAEAEAKLMRMMMPPQQQ